MSALPISLSPDLKRLRDEGYNLEIRAGYLLVKDIPYVDGGRELQRGILASKLDLAGDVATKPKTHVAYFIGKHPCQADGKEIEPIKNASADNTLAEGLVVNHTFSAKPKPKDSYDDYYEKVTTYVDILSGPAQAINPGVTARTFAPSVPDEKEDSVFKYIDTASSRAEIVVVTQTLAVPKIAIVGLGGTGSYVLDLVAKTPVKEIHLFDGDEFLQHNAFRAPGAPSIETLREKPRKSGYFKNIYSKMRHGIIDHEAYVTEENVEQLRDMSFVFLCMEGGVAKKLIVEKLERFGVPFVDAGLGVDHTDDALGGIVRVTTSTPEKRDHLRKRVSFSSDEVDNEYDENIQIADLNALNAVLAVIRWKKLCGFYRDLDREHNSTYTIDGNTLDNEDRR